MTAFELQGSYKLTAENVMCVHLAEGAPVAAGGLEVQDYMAIE